LLLKGHVPRNENSQKNHCLSILYTKRSRVCYVPWFFVSKIQQWCTRRLCQQNQGLTRRLQLSVRDRTAPAAGAGSVDRHGIAVWQPVAGRVGCADCAGVGVAAIPLARTSARVTPLEVPNLRDMVAG
jgi:hypothetical protein